jgi:V-type H+-transporting ATPase proteolipid subunit
VSVILVGKVTMQQPYGPYQGFRMMASGMCCGLSAFASGIAIGVVGEHSVRANAINEDFYVGMILILIFAEAIGLFGLIIAIILSQG